MPDVLRILLVDNYDSFTFNLKHLVDSRGNVALSVRRNDEQFLPEVERGDFDGVIIGPGPGSPVDREYFGYNNQIILDHGTKGLPVFGVCLGFQGMYHLFGGELRLGAQPVHGKTSRLAIQKPGCILNGVPQSAVVMRYHSIFAKTTGAIPDCLDITAYTLDENDAVNKDEPMALEHKEHPIYGVQFHPESFATEYGGQMIENFLSRCRR